MPFVMLELDGAAQWLVLEGRGGILDESPGTEMYGSRYGRRRHQDE
jgi:hypothetical protein